MWGLARKRLSQAERIVVVGFSAAPTDFYATWLLLSGVVGREDVEVFVVNPLNDPGEEEHASFASRMAAIFPGGYNSDLKTVAEVSHLQTQPAPRAE